MARQQTNKPQKPISVQVIVTLTLSTLTLSIPLGAVLLGVQYCKAPETSASSARKLPDPEPAAEGLYRGQVLRPNGRGWQGLRVEPNIFGMHSADTESNGGFTLKGKVGQEVRFSIDFDKSFEPYAKTVPLKANADETESHYPLRNAVRKSQEHAPIKGPVPEPTRVSEVPPPAPEPILPALFKGRVIEAPEGGPIVGALVSIDGVQTSGATTNEDGSFELDPGDASMFSITVEKPGYQSAQSNILDRRKRPTIKLRK